MDGDRLVRKITRYSYLAGAGGLVGMSIIQGGHILLKFLLCVLPAALSLGIALYEGRQFWRGR